MSSQARALVGSYVPLANAQVHVYAASVGSQKGCTVERMKERSKTQVLWHNIGTKMPK